MADCPVVYLFGHSFVSRLFREAQRRNQSVKDLIGLHDYQCDLCVEGHPGLTFDRLFEGADHYCSKMQRRPIDTLILDLGTNDLCNPDITPSVLIQKIQRFLSLLEVRGISPRCIVFLSVLQRSRLTRAGQVNLPTYNHRARRFNEIMRRRIQEYPNVYQYHQRKINYTRYLVDGCHLTTEGIIKYGRGVKECATRYCR